MEVLARASSPPVQMSKSVIKSFRVESVESEACLQHGGGHLGEVDADDGGGECGGGSHGVLEGGQTVVVDHCRLLPHAALVKAERLRHHAERVVVQTPQVVQARLVHRARHHVTRLQAQLKARDTAQT